MMPYSQESGQAPGEEAGRQEQGDILEHAPEPPLAAPALAGLRAAKPAKPPELLNPVVLAYVGDAVFELLVRQQLIVQPLHKMHHLHKSATGQVSAKAQRALLERWTPHLSEQEAAIVRRGRNAKSGSPPKNADMLDYRLATALECLVGFLYLSGNEARLQQLMQIAFGQHEQE